MSVPTRKVSITGPSGQREAILHLPAGEPTGYALFGHCFGAGGDLHAAWGIAESLAAHGFGVLRLDLGSPEQTDRARCADELLAAVEHLRAEHQAPAVLVGHSRAGAAALSAAGRIPEVEAVATIAAPADVDDQLPAQVRALRKPLLLCHGPRDQVVDVDNARILFEAAFHPKSFLSLDDADHLLTRRADAVYVGVVIGAWAARYVGDVTLPEPVERGEAGIVEVRGGATGFAQDIIASGYRLRSDEPEALGGTNTGPTPYDLLLSGLGACKSMTARMYAQRKGWNLDAVRVRLRHDKMHAADCEHCETRTGKLDRIDVQVWFEGDLDDEQRQRLLAITEKCPVERTLRSEIVIDTGPGDDD